MVRWQIVSIICLLALLLGVIISLNACGTNGLGSLSLNSGVQEQVAAPPPDPVADHGTTPDVPGLAPRNTLSLTIPGLDRLSPGEVFTVTLGGGFVGEVYQGSARISFDSQIVQPVSAERGDLLLGDMVHLVGLDQLTHVPFAFTALPRHSGIRDASGTLLTVEFRLLSPVGNTQPISLLNNAEFLQLRDRTGQRLSFDLETRSGVR